MTLITCCWSFMWSLPFPFSSTSSPPCRSLSEIFCSASSLSNFPQISFVFLIFARHYFRLFLDLSKSFLFNSHLFAPLPAALFSLKYIWSHKWYDTTDRVVKQAETFFHGAIMYVFGNASWQILALAADYKLSHSNLFFPTIIIYIYVYIYILLTLYLIIVIFLISSGFLISDF